MFFGPIIWSVNRSHGPHVQEVKNGQCLNGLESRSDVHVGTCTDFWEKAMSKAGLFSDKRSEFHRGILGSRSVDCRILTVDLEGLQLR